jgi:hypothetical protein
MSTTVLWIIVAVVAVIVVAGVLAMAGRNRRHTRLHGEAERIREEVGERVAHVERRTALADETAAKARAARAEADAKAAEAARLADRAEGLHRESASTREELDAQLEHADEIDPKVDPKADAKVDPKVESA